VRLLVTEDIVQIANAINAFSPDYHADFFKVRPIGRKYVGEEHPTEATALELASSLRFVLRSWGAGKRKAPELRGEQDFATALVDARLHSGLAKLAQISNATSLGFEGGFRLVNGVHDREALADFDATLLLVLRTLSDGLFLVNTNVTYPMKALLLISGLMPALDGQVRDGLGNAGFEGVARTQFLLPADAGGADAKKLTRLPYLLGQCWVECSTQLQGGIRQSNFRLLLQDPGRAFDVLLFMQAGKGQMPLLTLHLKRGHWYGLQ